MNAILGGVSDLVRQRMKAENIYNTFVNRIEVRHLNYQSQTYRFYAIVDADHFSSGRVLARLQEPQG